VVSLKYYSEINFDGMRKTTGDLSQDNRYTVQTPKFRKEQYRSSFNPYPANMENMVST